MTTAVQSKTTANGALDFLRTTLCFIGRNIRVFFKDKGLVFTSLISPLVILILYILFLHGVMRDSVLSGLGGFELDDVLINGFVAGYEVSSILAVSGVTVAFVANITMVDDRLSGARNDFLITPVNRAALVLGYYLATAAVTIAICYAAMFAGFIYIAALGWKIAAADVFCTMVDVLLTCLFGTALSSVVCTFLRSRGAITAVSTIVSFSYGFICGAYYPISQFADGMANTVMCLPGTYFTGLLHNHLMGAYGQVFLDAGLPSPAVTGIFDGLDVNMYFFGDLVSVGKMYAVGVSVVVGLIAIFVIINVLLSRKARD